MKEAAAAERTDHRDAGSDPSAAAARAPSIMKKRACIGSRHSYASASFLHGGHRTLGAASRNNGDRPGRKDGVPLVERGVEPSARQSRAIA
ncbi:hypothetical protein LPU83_pLPU83d_0681 (plasmid) [Rhizobium favelukesii]|uniref:Uncharacterized protein n=1 Tax=Rhizobium favelukesii TaxID=348824 RepID=W6S784_9HYPH|nr:hypothetical protein LPU83_pLPU83d_0681 [Rhizobium favelukesii]